MKEILIKIHITATSKEFIEYTDNIFMVVSKFHSMIAFLQQDSTG